MNINNNDLNKELIFIIIPIILTSVIFITLDIMNDIKIRKNYNNMIYNWNSSPLRSIE